MSKRFLLTLILSGVTALVLSGCSGLPSRNDNDVDTPLHEAAMENSLDVARLLIEKGADIDAEDDYGQTPLHLAAGWNTENGETPLHLDVASLLIDLGADIDAEASNGQTPLDKAILSNSQNLARLLIEHGANTAGIDLSWMK